MAEDYQNSMAGLVRLAVTQAIKGKTFTDSQGRRYLLKHASEIQIGGEIIIKYEDEPEHAPRIHPYHDHRGDQRAKES